MNPTQCRMARAALDWKGKDLADAAGVGQATVARFELGQTIQPDKMEAMRAAFVAAGIAFTNGGGRQGVSFPRSD